MAFLPRQIFIRMLILLFICSINFFYTVSSHPRILSRGGVTADAARKSFKDKDFQIDLTHAVVLTSSDMSTETADVSKYGVFGLPDVQSGVQRIYLKKNTVYQSHTHPRGSETIYVESGVITTLLRFEGLERQRIVQLRLVRGHVTVFPQGLPHSIKCNSDAGCNYVSFFNTGDPGVAVAPAFEKS